VPDQRTQRTQRARARASGDSRGVARAQAGDYAGAVEDFEAYIARPATASGVPEREVWVAALRRGENPFPRVELDRLIEQ